ncbi:hypothetical protein ACVCIC_28865 [Burkholderia glumae]|uniref:hypothetical protein n=1 Tax=Burkholderia TaxID=32008 RepID=UPI00041AADDE|nr:MULTISPECIES: hypothetical protein [Burkholderia]MCM2481856.1 hypothetical protein [Burkholderia glumae]MCM2508001.1 hypothetical protein [Burkholderia glumae]OMT35721.1 hypothetical protein AQ756_01220 [Burkholderia pseudomallei]QKM52890.1 hypothetical protein CG017_00884 [Burkholderia glumae]QTP34472.1 hypothetical protein B7759_03081 [Burkholderia glumae]
MSKLDGRFDWMPTYARFRKDLAEGGDADEFAGQVADTEYGEAMEQARAHGWSGVFHDEPHVFTLPGPDTMQFGLVWTQPDAELTTFVVSPQPLCWVARGRSRK